MLACYFTTIQIPSRCLCGSPTAHGTVELPATQSRGGRRVTRPDHVAFATITRYTSTRMRTARHPFRLLGSWEANARCTYQLAVLSEASGRPNPLAPTSASHSKPAGQYRPPANECVCEAPAFIVASSRESGRTAPRTPYRTWNGADLPGWQPRIVRGLRSCCSGPYARVLRFPTGRRLSPPSPKLFSRHVDSLRSSAHPRASDGPAAACPRCSRLPQRRPRARPAAADPPGGRPRSWRTPSCGGLQLRALRSICGAQHYH